MVLCLLCGSVSLKVWGGVVFERGHVERPSPSFEDIEDVRGLFACVLHLRKGPHNFLVEDALVDHVPLCGSLSLKVGGGVVFERVHVETLAQF